MSEYIKVAVDAMGGDNAPEVIVKGAIDAVNESKKVKVYLVGREDAVNAELAKYTYDRTLLEAQFAKQVYDDTIAQLDADYAQSAETYEQAQQEYNEYLGRVQNNTFYEDYEIASLKKAYEEAAELYAERKDY